MRASVQPGRFGINASVRRALAAPIFSQIAFARVAFALAVFSLAVLSLAVLPAAPARAGTGDGGQAFDHDARCLAAGALSGLSVAGVDFRTPVVLKIYAVRLKSDASALGLDGDAVEARKGQVELAYLQALPGNDAGLRMKTLAADAGACASDLASQMAPLDDQAPDRRQAAYDTDIACLMIYTTLPDGDPRFDPVLDQDARTYLGLFQADGLALGKTEADRMADFTPTHAGAAAKIMMDMSLSMDRRLLTEDGVQGESDRAFARTTACAGAAKGRTGHHAARATVTADGVVYTKTAM